MASQKSNRESIKVMVVSEFPVDSVIGNSDVSLEARKGILTYAAKEQPAVIFVDGLVSSLKDPEVLLPNVRERETIDDRIAASLNEASSFLKELVEASPSSEIYVAKTNADEYNVTQLDKAKAKARKLRHASEGGLLEREIEILDEQIATAKENGERHRLATLAGMKGSIRRKLRDMEHKEKYKQPQRGSSERTETRKEAFEDYYGRLESLVPEITVSREDTIQVTINDLLVEYVHNRHNTANVLKSRGGKAITELKERMSSGEEIPDIVIEGGHHAESSVQPLRHKDNQNNAVDRYTILVSSMVMEDQERVHDIATGTFQPELFDGVAKGLEAVKRQKAKNPPAGVSIVGRDEDGFFKWTYPLSHLADVGRGDVDPEAIEYNNIYVISDMHFGKGTTRYPMLRRLMDEIEEEIDTRVKEGKSTPSLFLMNEALQGYNYKTFPVELPRDTPDTVREKLQDTVKTLQQGGATPTELLEEIINSAVQSHEDMSAVRIEDQWKIYNEIMNRVIFKTLITGNTDPAMIFVEGNHVTHSVGEKGITETGMQTIPIKEVDRAIELLKEMEIIPPDTKIESLYDKIKVLEEGMISSYGAFEYTTGDQVYDIIAEHKPGSATPKSNALQKQIDRAHHRADTFYLYVAGHQHYAGQADEGLKASNDCRYIVKGGTFSEHDSYGKAGDWAPPTVGAVEVWLPETKGSKGPAKFWFRLSDVL